MTCSANMRTQSTEFVGVTKLVNCYVAIRIQGKRTAFVSEHPETDIKVAQATAKLFAEANNIPYNNTLLELSQPIITVLKNGQDWFPAELHADKVKLLESFGRPSSGGNQQEATNRLSLGGNQQEATNRANVIALSRGLACIPSIGISLETIDLLDNQ